MKMMAVASRTSGCNDDVALQGAARHITREKTPNGLVSLRSGIYPKSPE